MGELLNISVHILVHLLTDCIPHGTCGKYLEEKSVSLNFLGEWKGKKNFSFL